MRVEAVFCLGIVLVMYSDDLTNLHVNMSLCVTSVRVRVYTDVLGFAVGIMRPPFAVYRSSNSGEQ